MLLFFLHRIASRSSDAFLQTTQIGRQFGSEENEKNFFLLSILSTLLSILSTQAIIINDENKMKREIMLFFIYET